MKGGVSEHYELPPRSGGGLAHAAGAGGGLAECVCGSHCGWRHQGVCGC